MIHGATPPSRHGTHSLHVQLHHPHSANSNLARYLMASVDPSDCHTVHGSASHDGYDATSAYSELLLDIQCTCNQTHRVMYSHRKSNVSARVTVYGVTADDTVPPKVSVVPDAYNFLLYIEPPHNLEFDRAPGFDGLIGFRHAQNEREAAVWAPWCPQQRMWRAIRSWRYEPKVRTNIGIWTDNCNGYPAVWRTGVIDALLRSGLPVVSYGRCRRNSAKELWGMRVGDGESLVNSSDGGPGLCRKHRLMLAVENNACDGWISQNLCNVVEMCGAIPIIKSVNGWPDYRKLYGQIPLLNASKPGWLDEARRVMTDDGYYHKLLTSWRHERVSPFLNCRSPGTFIGTPAQI
ncbi:hypothetical protein AB1Y20_018767 [Prymnesium parvum]|uniref:Uncharacterized protein n=1 Tax=Prymnesium parvum TaxID=97485 RepID=A0AB34JT87_PRYPA